MVPNSSSGVVTLIQNITKNDDSSIVMSSFHSIADDTISHPEDIPNILATVFANLKSPAKDWRKINKTLFLILSLLKSGNSRVVEEIKKKEQLFKEMMEFFFIESRLDKGGVVRDKARIIFFMLANPGMIEAERGELKRTEKRNVGSTWKQEETYEKKPQVPQQRLFEERRTVQEPQKPNVFANVNVKTTAKPVNNLIQQDLLGDFSSPAVANVPVDLLMINEVPPKTVSSQNLLMEIPIVFEKAPMFQDKMFEVQEKKIEIQEKKPENKALFNMGGQGMSINSLKTTPSLNKASAPAPKPPSPPKDLESRLLNLDGLANSLTEAKPKPPPRSYY